MAQGAIPGGSRLSDAIELYMLSTSSISRLQQLSNITHTHTHTIQDSQYGAMRAEKKHARLHETAITLHMTEAVSQPM